MTRQLLYSFTGTLDDASQLCRDVSTALTSICEWRNSLIHINRIPLDVLSLIPTYLDSQKDRFNASHVCRHWRRTFLQNAALWSSLFLPKGEVYARTLLERVRGSPLDVVTNCDAPDGAITLLSPHTRQIRTLDFRHNSWTDIQRFSDLSPGPLPLLRTLKIDVALQSDNQPNIIPPPSLPLFANAINLEKFVLCLEGSLFPNNFAFPNLTTFKFSTEPGWYTFRALGLLDFLEASPTLRKVKMEINTKILLQGVAQGRVVLLPNVQTFSLSMDDGEPAYELAAHISCPSASHTSLVHLKNPNDIPTNQDVRYAFPTSTLWDAIVRQYTASPIEAISLEIVAFLMLSCTLTFKSSDARYIKLELMVGDGDDDDDDDDDDMSSEEVVRGVFYQASRAIRDYPLLHNVKHLHIHYSVPPLVCNEPINVAAIVELVKSRHGQGVPFERVTVHTKELPAGIRELLEQWVGVVECYGQ